MADDKTIELNQKERLALLDRLVAAPVEAQSKELASSVVEKLKTENTSFSRSERDFVHAFLKLHDTNTVLKKAMRKFSLDVGELWQVANAEMNDIKIAAKIEALREAIASIQKRIEELEQEKSK
ncbi:MAG TPA: hypothetical protein VN736_01260 [Candidatus Limnocylindrales bacterium]|nr:hypothetical protein [Candidatus Limnocylindrales bacterium]